MMKRIAIGFVALLILAGVGFYAIGGASGALLLYVKFVLRKDYGPTQEVRWQAGPADAVATPGKRPPNVILIVADDLGFNDITLNGGGIADGKVPTPYIDSIAREGVNFRNGYSANATCAPSRASMMTGRYATRVGYEFTPTPKLFMKVITKTKPPDGWPMAMYYPEREADLIPYEDMGLPTTEITIAKLMQGA